MIELELGIVNVFPNDQDRTNYYEQKYCFKQKVYNQFLRSPGVELKKNKKLIQHVNILTSYLILDILLLFS
jgi:hypothetical protein